MIITSHGTEDKENHDTEIQGVDYENLGEQINYEKVLCTDIKNYFTAETCPHLAEKPKIFIFQLCRYVAQIFFLPLLIYFFDFSNFMNIMSS